MLLPLPRTTDNVSTKSLILFGKFCKVLESFLKLFTFPHFVSGVLHLGTERTLQDSAYTLVCLRWKDVMSKREMVCCKERVACGECHARGVVDASWESHSFSCIVDTTHKTCIPRKLGANPFPRNQ